MTAAPAAPSMDTWPRSPFPLGAAAVSAEAPGLLARAVWIAGRAAFRLRPPDWPVPGETTNPMHHTSSAIPLSSLGKLPMTGSRTWLPLDAVLPDLEECGWRFVWEVVVMANHDLVNCPRSGVTVSAFLSLSWITLVSVFATGGLATLDRGRSS